MSTPRRKTDPRSHEQRLAELSSEQRQARFMLRLSAEVGSACDKWLKARGVPSPSFMGDYVPATAQSPPEPSSTQPDTGQRDGTTRGGG